jgi:hAT family C-terminal dimerisation region
MNMFGYIYNSFQACEASHALIPIIEKRWKQQEIPFLIVAYMLHPKYIAVFRGMAALQSQLQVGKMIQYCILYYKKYIGNDYGNLSIQVNRWFHQQYPEAGFYSKLPAAEFWCVMKPACRELAVLATFVLCLAVQSATCERLFSEFGNFSTKKRNRLHSKRVHMLAQIKREVLVMDEKEAATSTEKQMRVINAAELPKSSNEGKINKSESDFEEEISDNMNDNDGAGEHCSDNDSTKSLEEICSSWLEALDCFEEELFEQEQDIIISDLEIASDISNLTYSDGLEHRLNYPYPQSNDTLYPQEKLKGSRNMKLKLSELFPQELELPSLI